MGKVVLHFGKKLGKDVLRGSKHDSSPVWGRVALHFRGKKAEFLPFMWSRTVMYLGGRKLKSFPMWGRICHIGKDL